jgi:hypothetical protein
MLRWIGQRLLDPDGVHAHFREDCPRVRLLRPGEMRSGFTGRRASCPACIELAERKQLRRVAAAPKGARVAS